MEGFVIEIASRADTSRAATKKLRNDGSIPVIVYHRGEDSVAGAVGYKEFVRLAEQAKISQVFNFKSSDSHFNGKAALVRDIQKDYISGKVTHVDFQALKDDEAIKLTVPLHFVGDAVGVKTEGGALSIHSHDLVISCLPKDIPLFIEVDVTTMKLNSHLHARDLPLGAGRSLACSPDTPIVSVVVIKEEVIEAAAPAAAGEDAAAAAAGAAAAAPAAEADAKKAPAGKK